MHRAGAWNGREAQHINHGHLSRVPHICERSRSAMVRSETMQLLRGRNRKELSMRYRIEYADGRCCNFANSRKDLIEWLNLLKDETITDIRKLYKSGVSDSVMDIYKQYIRKGA